MPCFTTSSEAGITQKVIVMRHGERRDTHPNSALELDPPLTESGKMDVARVASQLKSIFGSEIKAQSVFLSVSPFLRTVETAKALQLNGIGSDRVMFVDNTLCEVFGPTHIKSSTPPTTLAEGHGALPTWGESIEEAFRRFVGSFLSNSSRYHCSSSSQSDLANSSVRITDKGALNRATLCGGNHEYGQANHGVTLASGNHFEEDLIDVDGDFQLQTGGVARTICLVTHGDAISAVVSYFYPSRVVYQTDFLSYVVMGRCGESDVFRLLDSNGVHWILDGVDDEPVDPTSATSSTNLLPAAGHRVNAYTETLNETLLSNSDAYHADIAREEEGIDEQAGGAFCASQSVSRYLLPFVQRNGDASTREATTSSPFSQDVCFGVEKRCASPRIHTINFTRVDGAAKTTTRREDLSYEAPSMSLSGAHSKVPLLLSGDGAYAPDYRPALTRIGSITRKKRLCVDCALRFVVALIQVGVIFQWNRLKDSLIYLFCVNVTEVSQFFLLLSFSQPSRAGSTNQTGAEGAAYRALRFTGEESGKAAGARITSSSPAITHDLDTTLDQRESLLQVPPSIRACGALCIDACDRGDLNVNRSGQASADAHPCSSHVYWEIPEMPSKSLLLWQFMETVLKVGLVFMFSLVIGFLLASPFTMYSSLIEIFTLPRPLSLFLVYCLLDFVRGALEKCGLPFGFQGNSPRR
ncbi:unnamed protein product [Phytomonas sp. EM1]|nr:unnamed protein product [Phytomonas sp. EM1]|eukprot:CCW62156.1 unnamed protein product [Phytomonas sp. isolate EM1]